jgi:hypothetical protein
VYELGECTGGADVRVFLRAFVGIACVYCMHGCTCVRTGVCMNGECMYGARYL